MKGVDVLNIYYPLSPSNPTPEEERAARQQLQSLGLLASLALAKLFTWAVSAAKEADRKHHRSELLAAYRSRESWKRGDLSHLRTLGVNEAALRRMSRLTGKGRPVVKPHQPLDGLVMAKITALKAIFDPASTPAVRRQAFKQWPWWRHYIEALYRGELELAKTRRIRSPSNHAKDVVGRAAGISPAAVHKICGEIRSLRKEWDGAANFPAITLAQYESMMATGRTPWMESDD